MTEERIQALLEEGMRMVADPTPERRAQMEKRLRDMNARCKKRTFEEWEAELESIMDRLGSVPESEKNVPWARRMWAIHNFLYNGEGPEPEWPWKAPEDLG